MLGICCCGSFCWVFFESTFLPMAIIDGNLHFIFGDKFKFYCCLLCFDFI